MNVYLDDNRADKRLAEMLRKAGHTVVCPADVRKVGASDARHLEYAIQGDLVVLTEDRDDFHDLHDLVLTSGGRHPGIMVVCYENNPKRDMKPIHIVAAIGKLERSGISLVNQIVVLNQWR